MNVGRLQGWPSPPPGPNGWTKFGGTIDEVASYRSTLSAAQIQAHRNRMVSDARTTVTTY